MQGGHDEGVAGLEEGVARLQLRAQVVLPGLLLGEDAAALRGSEGIDLAVEFLPAGGDAGVADADLGRVSGDTRVSVVGDMLCQYVRTPPGAGGGV